MTFQDLILVYWCNEEDPSCKISFSEEFSAFAELIQKSRYWEIQNSSKYSPLLVIDTVRDIGLDVRDWFNVPKYISKDPLTVYFGFQGGPGWTLPEFHDILNAVETIPAKYPGVVISWLPDNWFDHPGLTPSLHDGEHALQWMEQQCSTAEPEEINYDFKGVHHTNAEGEAQPLAP